MDELFSGGALQVAVSNEKGRDIPVDIKDNDDGTFTVQYNAPTPGKHTINVLYEGQQVPQSPLAVHVLPHVDVSQVRVDGLEPSESRSPLIYQGWCAAHALSCALQLVRSRHLLCDSLHCNFLR